MKFLEARVLAYYMMAPFIITGLVGHYTLKLEYFWGDRATIGIELFKNWSNISLQQEILFQRDSYYNCVNNEYIVSCKWTLEVFVKY